MPTNDERREVAARLRDLDEQVLDCREYEHRAICAVVGCWGDGEYSGMELKDRLADLIDPAPERTCYCKFVNQNESDSYGDPVCSSCGNSWDWVGVYCSVCGSKVVD